MSLPWVMSGMSSLPPFLYGLGSAYVSSGLGAAVVFPLDTIKVRIQNAHNAYAWNGNINNVQIPRLTLSAVIRGEGWRALYKGLVPKILTTGIEKTVKITTFNYVSKYVRENYNTSWHDVYAGLVAGTVQAFVISPAENLSIQMQTFTGSQRHMSMYQAFVQIGGVRRLYSGLSFCILRDAPFSAIYFSTMNYLLVWMADNTIVGNQSMRMLIAGSIAAVPAAFLVTPFDVIKTIMQANNRRASIINIISNVKQIYMYDGLAGFFKGGLFRVIRSTPQFGITMCAMSLINRL